MEKKYINHIIIYILILLIQGKRYIWFLPTIPFYPNNEKEIQKVIAKVNFRTFSNIEFFKLTDPSVAYAFEPIVEESVNDLHNIFLSIRVSSTINLLKYFYNRARPHQIDPSIKPLTSTTASTPSYPAGHAFQAYYLAKQLTIDPQHNMYLIFEDDTTILPNTYQEIQKSLQSAPDNWDMLMFYTIRAVGHSENKSFHKLKSFWGMNCYLINKQGAKKFVEEVDKNTSS